MFKLESWISLNSEFTNVPPLCVFSIVGPKQNAGSFMTQVSDTAFYALSHGTLGVALHGSFYNHFLIGGNFQQPIRIFEMGAYWNCRGEQNAGYQVKEYTSI